MRSASAWGNPGPTWHGCSRANWLTQKQLSELFQVGVPSINEHLKNIYDERELDPQATIRKFRIVQLGGGREVARMVDCYSLPWKLRTGTKIRATLSDHPIAIARCCTTYRPSSLESQVPHKVSVLHFATFLLPGRRSAVTPLRIGPTSSRPRFRVFLTAR